MSIEASGGGACVGSSDRSGGNNAGDEWRIEIDQIEESSDQRFSAEENEQFISFETALEVLKKKKKTDPPADAKPKIQKVPYKLRYNDKLKKYFEPKMFSFGPNFYYLDRTHKMAEQIKVSLAAEFLQQNGINKKDLYEEIKIQINQLKYCYDDLTYYDNNHEDHKLTWMFLVDGCAILQFMYSFFGFLENSESQVRYLGINTDYIEFLAQDLFLLENQLPYQLLRLIIRHTSKQDELLKSIYKFIFHCFRTSTPEECNKNKDMILKDLKHDHVHLLDLLRKKLIQPLHQIDEKRGLIEIIIDWTCFLFDKLMSNRNEFDRYRLPSTFRNIGKLKEAGNNLKRSKTSCVRDISFSCGTLNLPPIILKESTTTMFLNMIGYELHPDFHNASEVSTYMHFLYKLIDGTQDVEELREKSILQNELGSDEEVAELFNEIGSHLFPNELYSVVRWEISKYFHNKGFMWLRRVIHDIHQYFKNRWSLLALIAALLALASGIIQTVYTVLAYHADSKKGN